MIIHPRMDLYQLRERMGPEATLADACRMRDILVTEYDGLDTSQVPDAAWADCLARACQPLVLRSDLRP
jgi:hypothetical protein